MELQGEIQEERLQDYLEKIFPEDDIVDVSKGKKGGDCIQTINYKDKNYTVREAANYDQAAFEIDKQLPDIAVIDVK